MLKCLKVVKKALEYFQMEMKTPHTLCIQNKKKTPNCTSVNVSPWVSPYSYKNISTQMMPSNLNKNFDEWVFQPEPKIPGKIWSRK